MTSNDYLDSLIHTYQLMRLVINVTKRRQQSGTKKFKKWTKFLKTISVKVRATNG